MRFTGSARAEILSAAFLLALLLAVNSPVQARSDLVATPSIINFGNQTIGAKSAPIPLKMTNETSRPITIQGVSVSSGQFSYTGISLPVTVKSGQSWSGTVTFAPSASGPVSGAISFQVRNLPSSSAVLSGSGVMPVQVASPGTLVLNPSAINFGSEQIGATASHAVTVTNTGASSVTISNVIVAGAGVGSSGMSPGLILGAAQAATLNVSFDPAGTGTVAGSITIVSNATNSPASLSLSGTGTSVPAPASLLLSWNASTSTVAGYNVYSGNVSGGPYTKLTGSPVATTSYSDTGVQSGQTYYFVATSIDSSNAESAFSNEISATVP